MVDLKAAMLAGALMIGTGATINCRLETAPTILRTDNEIVLDHIESIAGGGYTAPLPLGAPNLVREYEVGQSESVRRIIKAAKVYQPTTDGTEISLVLVGLFPHHDTGRYVDANIWDDNPLEDPGVDYVSVVGERVELTDDVETHYNDEAGEVMRTLVFMIRHSR